MIPGIGPSLRQSLFSANEPGGIWDWSDRSTLFQDFVGNEPVTASGQTAGLHLDKSQGLQLGSDIAVNGQFDSTTGWTLGSGATISDGRVNCVNAADFLEATGFSVPSGKWYEVRFDVVEFTSGLNLRVRFGSGVTTYECSATAGPKRVICFSDGTTFQIQASGSLFTGAIDNVSVRELPGNHRYQATPASRPQYIQEGNIHYGLYDGVDDFFETNSANFTSTDKATIWWGGRKLSDATDGCLLELSESASTNNGSFNAFSLSTGAYTFQSRGTVRRDANTSTAFGSPRSDVLCGIGDISGDSSRIRINGVQAGQNLSDQGTGNYGNYKLFFGRRAGSSAPANMREHLTIIRGAQTSANLIAQVEREVARKVGISW